jgi:arylsulfatase A-like enzyme
MPRGSKPAVLLVFLIGLVACRARSSSDPSFFFAPRASEAEKDFDERLFRSFRKDGSIAANVTMGKFESRFSLVPFVPSRLRYRMKVPEGARLDFDIGVSTLGRETSVAPVTFTVEAASATGIERVFEGTVRRRFVNRWFHHRIDLASYAGQEISLTFGTEFRETGFTGSRASLARAGQAVVPAWGHPVLAGTTTAAELPPMILISIDCLRADHVGAYGYEKPTTPNLDALARDGLLFEKVATVSSWTLPTHMSLLTGLMPTEHGLNRVSKRNPSVPYLPEILAREGYETLGVVSGLYLSPAYGYNEGFHVYRALIDEPAEVLVAAARELLLAEPRRPRFLFLHFFDAHWPYLPRKGYLERFGGRPAEVTTPLKRVINETPPARPDEVTALERLYDAEVAYVDEKIGEFFAALKRAGLYDQALIVVTADHGEAFYEHELWQHSGVIYNEVTRVPLIVKEPHAPLRKRVTELVSQLNVFPTFLEQLGLPSPYVQAGLSSLARGRAAFPQRTLTEITWEPTPKRGAFVKVAVSEARYKYAATFAGEKDDQDFVSRLTREELYDLSLDPGETTNLLPGAEGSVASLRGEARKFLERVRRHRRKQGEPVVLDEQTRERLRSLGYVQP